MLNLIFAFLTFGFALGESLTQPPLSLSNSTVSFDIHDGAKKASRLDRQLISMSIEFVLSSILPKNATHPVLRN